MGKITKIFHETETANNKIKQDYEVFSQIKRMLNTRYMFERAKEAQEKGGKEKEEL